MTDQELIKLLTETPHDELESDVLTLLRQRLRDSEQVREALAEYLRLEGELAGTLTQTGITATQILKVAEQRAARPRRIVWAGAIALSLLAAAVAVAINYPRFAGRPTIANNPGPDRPGTGTRPNAGGGHVVPPDEGANTPPDAGANGGQQQNPPPGNNGGAAQAVAQAHEPWATAMAEPPQEFLTAAMQEFSPQERSVSDDNLRRWFTPVMPAQLQLQPRRNEPTILDGLVRLRAPWTRDAALRVHLSGHHGLQIHLFAGQEGVTLQYQQQRGPTWAAYGTARAAGQNQPHTMQLVAADESICRRAGPGTVMIHWQDGLVILSRGDVPMLYAPLATPPKEIYFQGKAEWRGLAMVRLRAMPAREFPQTLVHKSTHPAKLVWSEKLADGGKLQKLADGAAELSAPAAKQPGNWSVASIRLEEHGLHEYVIQVEDPSAGTGVLLTDIRGDVLGQVSFVDDQRTSRLMIAATPPGERRDQGRYEPDDFAPLAGKRPWLKLIAGLGVLKVYVSGDGRHWSPLPGPPPPLRRGECAHLAIYCAGGAAPRKIRLRQLEVHELGALLELAPADVRERAVALDEATSVGDWLQAVAETQPADVESAIWRRACALRTLGASPSSELAHALLEGLLHEAMRLPLPLKSRLHALDQAARIANTWIPQHAAGLAKAYEELGEQLVAEGATRPFSTIAPELVASPITGPTQIQAFPGGLLRQELLRSVHQERWEDVVSLIQRLRFWREHDPNRRDSPADRLIAWTASQAARGAPRNLLAPEIDSLATVRQPLIEALSKEGYNILAEFEAALQSRAYDDACQIISTADTQGALGLLPDARERPLLVSLSGAVTLALRDHPQLGEAMREKFGPAGKLRVHEAIAQSDASAVQAATVQFMGTEAAALAHSWLGDRSLSQGDCTQAMVHYRRALPDAAADERAAIAARLRLASALLGYDQGQPPQQSVEYGGVTLSPSEFEQLVAELRTGRGGPATSVATAPPASAFPPPSRYGLAPFAELAGTRPGDQGPQNIDWAARQYAFAVAVNYCLISDSFSLVAVDAASGQQRWAVPSVNPAVMPWAGVVSQPAVVGNTVYWRRITRDKADVISVQLADGKLLWTARTNPWSVISDPFWVQEKLQVLATQQRPDRTLQVALLTLSADGGELVAAFPLAELRDEWDGRCPAAGVVSGDRVVATIGGCVMSCDAAGQVRWLRRQPWMPAALDPFPHEQGLPPPLVDTSLGGRVLVTQRGVREVQCLDLETGRLLWQYTDPYLRRVCGVSGKYVIVDTSRGMVGLGLQDGKFLWSHPVDRSLPDDRMPEAVFCHESGQVLSVERFRNHSELDMAELVWLDAATGEDVARWPLETLSGKQLRAGPFFANGPNTFLLTGTSHEETKRTMHRLLPQAGTAYAGRKVSEFSPWLDEPTRQAGRPMASVLPGWTLVATTPHPRLGLHTWQSESMVAATCATPGRPACFLRYVNLPAGQAAKLRLQVGQEGGQPWRLEVRGGGRTLLSEDVSPTAAPQGWLTKEVDLSPLAGGPAWIAVLQKSTGKPPQAMAFWKQLEIILADGRTLASTLEP